jgi:ankyrin repeat protein
MNYIIIIALALGLVSPLLGMNPLSPQQRQDKLLLLNSSLSGNLEVVNKLLLQGVDPSFSSKYKGKIYTPLRAAIQKGHVAVAERLLQCPNHTVNTVDECGNTPLHLACGRDYHSLIKLLVARGAHVNKTDSYGYTPLHIACRDGNYRVIKPLMASKAQLNIYAKDGTLPLYSLVSPFEKPVPASLLRYMLEQGADPFKNPLKINPDYDKDSPYRYARDIKNIAPAARTFFNTVREFSKDREHYTLFLKALRRDELVTAQKIIKQRPGILTIQDKRGRLLTHHAAALYKSAGMKLLVNNKADVTKPDKNGKTPLMVAHKQSKSVEKFLDNYLFKTQRTKTQMQKQKAYSNRWVQKVTTKKPCDICFEENIQKQKTPWCKHYFCTPCLQNWAKINNSCPTCRATEPL